MYPEEICTPMREELISEGFISLNTAEEVKDLLEKNKGTVLLVVNSVCGCAAGNARPAVIMSTKFNPKVDVFATVFAGQDKEATQKAREYMLPYPPSSPSIAVFKDGSLVHCIERHHIEGRSADIIAENLRQCFKDFCN